jgi:hypothetical protein
MTAEDISDLPDQFEATSEVLDAVLRDHVEVKANQ